MKKWTEILFEFLFMLGFMAFMCLLIGIFGAD